MGAEFKLYSGNTPSRLNKNNFSGNICWITSGELKAHYIEGTKEKISQEAAYNSNLQLLPAGTFVIAIYGLEAEGIRGTGSITTSEATISQACMAFSSKGNVSNEFLYSWYKRYGNVIGIKYAQGTKQQNLSYDLIERLKVYYPSKEEQQKLTDFISLLDRRIALQNKVIEDLNHLKEATSKRFLKTRGIPGRVVTLGEITEVVSRRNKQRDIFPMYSVTNDKGFIPQSEQFEDREMVGEDIAAYKIIHNGEIAYNPARINVGSIAQYTGEHPCMISSLYVCIRARAGVLSNWLIQVLRSEQLINRYNLYAEGGVRLYLFYPNFSKIKIYLPSIEQQKKIADTLEVIEKKIKIESSILAGYQQTKRAMLLNLFV